MCGIAGFSRLTPRTKAMAPFLAQAMMARGKDSWGITNGEKTFWNVGAIRYAWAQTWKDVLKEFDPTEAVAFHTRGASVGAVNMKNCHPFVLVANDRSKKITLMHNGHIGNHEKLKDLWKLDTECDSATLAGHIVNGGDTRDVVGWGTVVYWIADRNPQYDSSAITGPQSEEFGPMIGPYFVRFNGGDLAVWQLETGEVVWASTSEALDAAVDFTGAKVHKRYIIDTEFTHYLGDEKDVEPWMEGNEVTECLVKGGEQRYGFRTGLTSGSGGVVVGGRGMDVVNDLFKTTKGGFGEGLIQAKRRLQNWIQECPGRIREIGKMLYTMGFCPMCGEFLDGKAKRRQRGKLICEKCLKSLRTNIGEWTWQRAWCTTEGSTYNTGMYSSTTFDKLRTTFSDEVGRKMLNMWIHRDVKKEVRTKDGTYREMDLEDWNL